MKAVVFFLACLSLTLAFDLSSLKDIALQMIQLDAKEIKELIDDKEGVVRSLINRHLLAKNSTTTCSFNNATQKLHCKSSSGEVECPTVFEVKEDFQSKVFGLERIVPELNNQHAESVKYWLYPRLSDNMTFVNHTTIVDGVSKDLLLYYSAKFVDFGLRVTQKKCYQRLVTLIKNSPSDHQVNLQTDLPVKSIVSLIGEISISDKNGTK